MAMELLSDFDQSIVKREKAMKKDTKKWIVIEILWFVLCLIAIIVVMVIKWGCF
jgi:t-SNARE complex subunit (syntaxin)